MKIRITLPSDEHFFQRYAALAPTLNKLGWMAQVVSALTEVGILFALIRNAVADIAPPVVAAAAGAAGAVLGTAFIEIGLRKFLPYSFRQILYKRFAGLDLVMSIAIFSACVLLVSASGYLSFQGSKETVEQVTPPANLEDTSDIDTTVNSHKEANITGYRRDSATIAARYATQIAAADAAHQAAQDARKTRLRTVEAKERNQGTSYATQKANIRQEMADANAAHAGAIAALHADQASELLHAQNNYSSLEKDLKRERDEWMAALKKRNEATEQKRERNVRAWGGSVAWFTVLCLFVLILSIGLQEVHRKGAGMQEEVLPSEYEFRQDVVSSFFSAIKERWLSSAHAWIKEFEDGTPDPPEPGKPPVLYEYEQKAERRPIGFHTREKPKAKEEVKDLTGIVAYDFRIDGNMKICEHCKKSFVYRHAKQKFCTEDCRKEHWEMKNGRKPYLKKTGK